MRLGVAVLGCLLLAGCNQPKKRVIGVVPKATSHLFFVAVHEGVTRAGQDFGVEVSWNGPNDETDHARQIQIVDAMVTRRVDALAISATDERALAAPVQRAIDAGIPVTVFDSGVNVDGYVQFVATDNYGAGRQAARRMAKLLGGKGKIAMVMQKPGGTSTVLRERGFTETLEKEFPNVKVVGSQFGLADVAKSRAVAENMLTATPDLDGMFASSEAGSLGAIGAIQSRGVAGKVKLITFDTSDRHIEALMAGTIDVMLVQDSYQIGYQAVRSLAEKLSGGSPVKRVDLPVREITKDDFFKPGVKELLAPLSKKK